MLTRKFYKFKLSFILNITLQQSMQDTDTHAVAAHHYNVTERRATYSALPLHCSTVVTTTLTNNRKTEYCILYLFSVRKFAVILNTAKFLLMFVSKRRMHN